MRFFCSPCFHALHVRILETTNANYNLNAKTYILIHTSMTESMDGVDGQEHRAQGTDRGMTTHPPCSQDPQTEGVFSCFVCLLSKFASFWSRFVSVSVV